MTACHPIHLHVADAPAIHVRAEVNAQGGPALPDYEGPTSVVPSKSAQSLHTSGMAMRSDVTVEAIPDRYPDVSKDTVTASTLAEGATAHDASGGAIVLPKARTFGNMCFGFTNARPAVYVPDDIAEKKGSIDAIKYTDIRPISEYSG